jgi:hypothetical protein
MAGTGQNDSKIVVAEAVGLMPCARRDLVGRRSMRAFKKPDLPQNESCGRLDREQAGLCNESRGPPPLMKAWAKKE